MQSAQPNRQHVVRNQYILAIVIIFISVNIIEYFEHFYLAHRTKKHILLPSNRYNKHPQVLMLSPFWGAPPRSGRDIQGHRGVRNVLRLRIRMSPAVKGGMCMSIAHLHLCFKIAFLYLTQLLIFPFPRALPMPDTS